MYTILNLDTLALSLLATLGMLSFMVGFLIIISNAKQGLVLATVLAVAQLVTMATSLWTGKMIYAVWCIGVTISCLVFGLVVFCILKE